MLQEIIKLYPVALLPVTALSALLAPPLRQATPEKSLPQTGKLDASVCTALLVFPQQPRGLLQLLEEIAAETFFAADVREAQERLREPNSYDLLFVAAELPDGSWQDLLPLVCNGERPCEMIVCSRLGDERLWAEVIARGAYDLIAEPYDEREVLRIIQGALDRQFVRRCSRRKAA